MSSAVQSASRSVRKPSVRPISQVALRLTDSSAFENSVAAAVRWMNEPKRCNGHIPKEAFTGAPFELNYGGGSMPAAASLLAQPNQRVWAARLDFPDARVGQRTWSTEMSVSEAQGAVLFLARLTNTTLGDDVPYSPSVPGIVYRILSMFSVEADGYALSEEADEVDESSVGDFIELLRNPNRTLPVVAVSREADGSVRLDSGTIIRRVAGAAHVACLSAEASWILSRTLGRHLSVYNGAGRLYLPSANLETDDPFRHPVHFTSKEGDSVGYANWLARTILPSTFVRPRPEFERTRFATIRAQASDLAREAQAKSTAGDATQALIISLRESLAALQKQHAEDAEAAQGLLDEAADLREAALEERNELASENERLRAKLRALSRINGDRAVSQVEPLLEFSEFSSWADKYLGDHIEVLPRALRDIEKYGSEEWIETFYQTLLCIRDYYVPMRRDGGLELKRQFEERCAELRVEESGCFAQRGDIKAFPSYRVRYGSEQVWLDRHFKYGAGYDLRRMFRIYFYWDEPNAVCVIGHMPTHLDNNNTN